VIVSSILFLYSWMSILYLWRNSSCTSRFFIFHFNFNKILNITEDSVWIRFSMKGWKILICVRFWMLTVFPRNKISSIKIAELIFLNQNCLPQTNCQIRCLSQIELENLNQFSFFFEVVDSRSDQIICSDLILFWISNGTFSMTVEFDIFLKNPWFNSTENTPRSFS